VLELEVFIGKLRSVNRFAPSSIKVSEVTTLHHETFNNSVEDAALVVQRLARELAPTSLSCAELSEVLRGSGHDVLEKLHDNSAFGLSVDLDVEKYSRVRGV